METLQQQLEKFTFQPEVYLYPTPRMYTLLDNFNLKEAQFTDDINIYVHIPFCKQICSFCGYLKMIDSSNLRTDYVGAILTETKLYRDLLRHKQVKTLHFGGGTPSLLEPSELEKIITALREINPQILLTCEEVSIEATPESIDQEKFSAYQKLGINRVSLGVQSFDNTEIALSKRHNLSAASIQAITILRELNIPNIVIDLMIGIEGQTFASFEQSVKTALELRPETVELYALGLMPQTGLGKRLPTTLMSPEEIYLRYEIGRALFLGSGYKQDCHNRYAIHGRGSFLQEDYVFQGMSLIGFGAGVRSYATNVHYRNTYESSNGRRAILEYITNIKSGKHSIDSGIFLDSEERMRQYVIGNFE